MVHYLQLDYFTTGMTHNNYWKLLITIFATAVSSYVSAHLGLEDIGEDHCQRRARLKSHAPGNNILTCPIDTYYSVTSLSSVQIHILNLSIEMSECMADISPNN